MSKVVNKVIDILLKCAKFCVVQIILSCFKFHQVMVDTVIKELQILLLTPMLATATEKWKSLNVKFSVKFWYSDRVFYVTVANVDTGSLKYNLIP